MSGFRPVDHPTWKEAQQWERDWWGLEPNRRWTNEVAKQTVYAKKTGMPADLDFLALPEYGGRRSLHILDVGCGPTPILLRASLTDEANPEPGAKVGVDPIAVSESTLRGFQDANIRFLNIQAEALTPDVPLFGERHFDEVWMYNCLQHVEDPHLILDHIARVGRRVRIFEWLGLEPSPGHPWKLTEPMFTEHLPANEWQRRIWDADVVHEGGCHGKYMAIDVTHAATSARRQRPRWVRPEIAWQGGRVERP